MEQSGKEAKEITFYLQDYRWTIILSEAMNTFMQQYLNVKSQIKRLSKLALRNQKEKKERINYGQQT